MKKILFFLMFVLLMGCVSATNYYFSNSGSDASTTGNITNPFATITKYNSLTKLTGDDFYFECGSVWRLPHDAWINDIATSGTNPDYIKYTSYGTCNGTNKPKFIGAENETTWTEYKSNIWKSDQTFSQDVGNIIFNDGTLGGIKKWNIGNLTASERFWYNSSNDKVYLYCTENPVSHYTNIELATADSYESAMFDYNNRHNINFTGLDVTMHGLAPFNGDTVYNIYVKNNSISYMGGMTQSGTLRYGGCFDTSLTSDNIYFGYNTINDCWDECFGFQSWSSAGKKYITNHLYEYNIGSNCGFGFAFFNSNISGSVINITARQNTLHDIGGGVFSTNTDQVGGRGFRVGSTPTNTYNVNITDNIVYNVSFAMIDFNATHTTRGDFNFDHNLYYLYNGQDSSSHLFLWDNNYLTFTAFKTASGQEANGQYIDPQFVGDTYVPLNGTLVCNMSSTGSYVGALPCYVAPVSPPVSNFGKMVVNGDIRFKIFGVSRLLIR